ncbi:hypothetical protein ABL78_2443 [Leptomonas seymouri]|uniref:Arrestin-like N-terminal domain-containing protein n=1 Tax=Leptomonas seymouri TaxID=5684 RepID=A0A0N1I967_LEPSE|nr:hypothetical protein ABL78_2443 [Leptomonas seymouri]|eukprot:KPI88430.1 hypothetical protein ABL78_2443 [Leptomonas seymouri]
MLRRYITGKAKTEPEVNVLLRKLVRYPGDTLQGVVIVNLTSPVDLLTLEVRLFGEERATIGGLVLTDKNPEARKTLYYEQFITLRGVDHDALQQRRSLLGRCRTVVSQEALLRKSALSTTSLSNRSNNNGSGASLPNAPLQENSTSDMSPSICSVTSEVGGFVRLVPGTYSFPFSLILPESLPPSLELNRAREGSSVLRYRAVANMILGSGKVYTAETPLRVSPLPVQIQRWYQLHGDEQNGADASEVDDAEGNGSVLEGAPSRASLKALFMSPPGTIGTDAADREREVTCQRRIQHHRHFPETQLLEERAEYERLAESEEGEKGEEANGSSSPHTVQAASVNEKGSGGKSRPKTYRERRAKQDEGDNRSVDGNCDNCAAVTPANYDEDMVYVFSADQQGSGQAPSAVAEERPLFGSAAGRSLAANACACVDSPSKEMKVLHRLSDNGDVAVRGDSSAMLLNNVEQLTFTPPDADLEAFPNHTAMRQPVKATSATTTDAAAATASNEKSRRHHKRDKTESNGNEEEKKSQGTQTHRHRHHSYAQPPWHQNFSISLRGGFLRSGKVKVQITLRSPLVSVGYGKAMVKLLVDNTEGSGAITKVKYSLITRCYIRSRSEVFSYHVENVEITSDVNIEKGYITAIPEVEVPVPKSTPLTVLTEGMGTLTFLNVRLYVSTAIKTFSKSVETEVVLVPGQDLLNKSRRLLRWTCFYRRRNSNDTRELTIRPPTINLSEQNAKVHVLQAEELALHAVSLNSNNTDTDTSSIASSAISRSLMILRTSRRTSKSAPPLDTRRLVSTLNFDEAIFVPPIGDVGLVGRGNYVDPTPTLNPFVAPSVNIGSTLPSEDQDGEASQ